MPDVLTEPHAAEWQAFRARLLGMVRRRVNDPADAEDLVQDILARASRRLSTLREHGRLVPWLDAMTRNALVDYYRQRGRAPDLVELDDESPDHEASEPAPGDLRRQALAACVRPMLDALPPLYREALRRVDLEGERQVDVAADLGLGISALKSRVQRGRALLRDAFSACCRFDRDAAGRVVGFDPKRPSCPAQTELTRLESVPRSRSGGQPR